MICRLTDEKDQRGDGVDQRKAGESYQDETVLHCSEHRLCTYKAGGCIPKGENPLLPLSEIKEESQ